MDLQLNDRVVIVTGAAAGIGHATAGLLTAEGAVVVGVDRDDIETGLGIDEDQWLDAFQLNFHAARRMSGAALPPMLEGGVHPTRRALERRHSRNDPHSAV
jgi:NAD(P)-dependent dehydrogenase (short-subunit alcohol dehydrogenase family)